MLLGFETRRSRRERIERYLKEHKVPFDQIVPPKKRYGGDNSFCIASTFKPENPLDGLLDVKPGLDNALVYKDRLRYVKLPLPIEDGLPIGGANDLWASPPMIFFDEVVDIPVLDYQEGGRWRTWMSLTPFEFYTQRSGIMASTGHVILGGLGMGWLLTQIAKKPSVKKITVVEKDTDLLEWFGNALCAKFPKVDQVVNGDFWEYADKCDFSKVKFIADVWPGHRDAESDKNLISLRARDAKVWAWGSSKPTADQQIDIDRLRRKLAREAKGA